MLFVANSAVIGNGDYTDEVANCTAEIEKVVSVLAWTILCASFVLSVLCGEQPLIKIHHRDTKNTEIYTEKARISSLRKIFDKQGAAALKVKII